MQFKRFTVKKNERGILLRDGDFERVLHPGTHWLFTGLGRLDLTLYPLDAPAFVGPLADHLMAHEPAVVAAEFVQVVLNGQQVGLRSENGVPVEVLPPDTRRLYWKGQVDVQVEVFDIAASADVPAELLPRLLQRPWLDHAPAGLERQGLARAEVQRLLGMLGSRPAQGLDGVLVEEIPEHGTGILRIDGKVDRLLAPGVHGFWRFNRHIAVETIDLRLQTLDVSGQEILTLDKVSLRLNLSATWRYSDVRLAYQHMANPAVHLYRALQLGLRAAVGTRTLDELLENKSIIDEVVAAQVATSLQGHGLQLESVGVKDLVLPGDMKALLGQVVAAGKAAEANVIRRREETAATRSLLNTAKVMEGNPVALRMKELETLERVAERIDKISVFGGLDQVLNGLVKLR